MLPNLTVCELVGLTPPPVSVSTLVLSSVVGRKRRGNLRTNIGTQEQRSIIRFVIINELRSVKEN
jgi:hypothetical protein